MITSNSPENVSALNITDIDPASNSPENVSALNITDINPASNSPENVLALNITEHTDNEEKRKYFKYKQKYLELKKLIKN
jgi:hypothetical protein